MSISAVVVVVSPLISLMHNQVSKLVATFSVNNVAAELKALSDGAEFAGIAKYFLTIWISMGNQNPLLFHHWSGFSWVDGSPEYRVTSAHAFWKCVIVS